MKAKTMRSVLVVAALCASVDASAAARDVETRIDRVTVYQSEAMVTRTTRLTLPVGPTRLKLLGFPARMRDTSARVLIGGSAKPILSGFSVERVPAAEEVVPQARALRKQLEALRERDASMASQSAHLRDQEKYLRQLRSRFSAKLLKQKKALKVDLPSWERSDGFLAAQFNQVYTQIATVARLRRRLRKKIDLVRKRLAKMRSKRSTLTKALMVDVEARRPGSLQLEVRYKVPSVSWRSLYDARLVGREVRLTHYALVTQESGEDWDQVVLSVSTANTRQSVRIPKLHARNLRVRRYYSGRYSGKVETLSKSESRAPAKPRAMPAPPPPPPPPPAPEAEARHAEYVTTYEAATRVTIPSSESGRKTPIADVRIPVTIQHLAAPVRAQGAFMIATGMLGRELPLPTGSVSLYFGSEYVGRTHMPQVVPGAKVRLPFGRDDRVRVMRQMLLRKVHEQGVFTKETRIDYRFRILVKNNSRRRIRLTVLDRIPVSQHEKIKVELFEDTTPRSPSKRRDARGVLRWSFTLGAQQGKAIQLGYSVTYPRGKFVRGLM